MAVRTLSCPIPENTNPLSPNGFMFSIAKLPELTFFCQDVTLPSISMVTIEQANPFVKIPQPGEMLDFDPLTVQFLVDNKMANYKAIYDWLYALGYPDSNVDAVNYSAANLGLATRMNETLFSDATLTILDNTNNPIQTIEFTDVFPSSIQSLTFSSTNNDVQYLVGSATFNYTLYKFI
jgi:hypothetical protein